MYLITLRRAAGLSANSCWFVYACFNDQKKRSFAALSYQQQVPFMDDKGGAVGGHGEFGSV
jgi:hypothetical protein